MTPFTSESTTGLIRRALPLCNVGGTEDGRHEAKGGVIPALNKIPVLKSQADVL